MTVLVLTGFMGTGKTSVGRAVAARLDLPFVDTDEEIERRSGLTVAQIFTRDGEAAFRRLEREVLSELSLNGGCVMATGGGTLIPETCRQLLPPGARVICLTADPGELEERLRGATDRPLLQGGRRQFESLMTARAETYARFEQLDTTGLTVEQVADEVVRRAAHAPVATIAFETRRDSQIYFGPGLISSLGELARAHSFAGQALVVTDDTVDRVGHARRVQDVLSQSGLEVHAASVPSGEEHKSLETVQGLYAECSRLRLDRRAAIVGVGGGVVCDLAGMLAATYLRGLRLILVPTTLLAQADAAIGGKVGVDFGGGKNLVGAFYPAELVLIDPEVLRTLPVTSLSDGLAEIVKTGAVLSARMLDEAEGLASPEEILVKPNLIRQAAQAKARLVERDPYEAGPRMLLNFGHTIGHGIEAASEYRMAHGAAVSVGMVAETRLAQRRGWCRAGLAERLACIVQRLGLPTLAEGIDPAAAWELMALDKKRAGSTLRFAVPTAAGQGNVFDVSHQDARAALDDAIKGAP